MNNRIYASLIATAALSLAVLASSLQVNAQTMKTNTMKSDTMKAQTMMGMSSSHKLVSVGAPTTGTVEVSDTTIKLKNYKTEAGPDLHVYLYADAVPAKTAKKLSGKFIDLGKLPAPFKGNTQFKIPAGTKLENFKSVIIWCDVAKVTFAGAALK